jgi:hypothetical protein
MRPIRSRRSMSSGLAMCTMPAPCVNMSKRHGRGQAIRLVERNKREQYEDAQLSAYRRTSLGTVSEWGRVLRYRSLASVELFRRKHGLWRSLVAHYTGGVGVAGSNPVSPTATQWRIMERDRITSRHEAIF